MEASQSSTPNIAAFRKVPASRRVLTKPEEEVLLLGFKDLIEKGWKSDNGFRTGYLGELQTFIRARFPTTTITPKNITSKQTVWKKTYGQVLLMQRTSGFGFDEDKNMITCEDDVWANYVKVHPDVENMRFKSFPYYRDWEEVFGKDKATGDEAQNLHDDVLDLLHPHLEAARRNESGENVVDEGSKSENLSEEEGASTTKGEHGSSKKKDKKKEKKKRKSMDSTINDPMLQLLGGFFDRNNNAIESIASRMAERQQATENKVDKDSLVFQTVGKINGLPHDMKIYASFRITEMQKADLFLGMDETSQATFVQMILEGRIGK